MQFTPGYFKAGKSGIACCGMLLSMLIPWWQPCFAWEISDATQLAQRRGVEHWRVKLARGRVQALLHLALFDEERHTLRVIDRATSQAQSLAEAMESGDFIAGINGGYFHRDYEPVGLVVSRGEVIHSQERASLLSGVLAVTEEQILILRPSRYRLGKRTREALQAGPFLLEQSKPVSGLDDRRKARRTVVAENGSGKFALISASPLTLAQAAQALAAGELAPGFRVEKALNMDGGSSTAFWFAGGRKAFYLRPLTGLRNCLGIIER